MEYNQMETGALPCSADMGFSGFGLSGGGERIATQRALYRGR
jgi:hypothetical protein